MENWLFDGLLPENRNNEHANFLSRPDGLALSYLELQQASAKAANALIAIGLKPDDRVAVQIDKSSDSIILYLATIRAGGVFLPLNTAYVISEIDYFLADAKPLVFVCAPDNNRILQKMAIISKPEVFTLDAEGCGSWQKLCSTQSNIFNNVGRKADHIAAILYTSGTTGRAKGAMLSHDNLLSNARTLARYWQYKGSDILLHALPVYHTHGLFVAINITLLAGASMIYLQRFDTLTICQFLPSSTVLMGVPTFYTRLMDCASFTADLCQNIRLFISGSAPLLAEDHRRFAAITGQVIVERYGMTETNMNTSNPYKGERKAGTVGLPLSEVQLRIVDQDTGAIKNCDETGMIEVKGPNVFKGYWQMSEKTAAEFTNDGYFITGDLGSRDIDGYISIVGREKDLIISGGLNVYPKDVELALNQCNNIIDSAVIGIADADLGEAVIALVVCADKDSFDQAMIKDALAERLAGYKRPKQIFLMDKLPRNTMGKVQKNRLREIYG